MPLPWKQKKSGEVLSLNCVKFPPSLIMWCWVEPGGYSLHSASTQEHFPWHKHATYWFPQRDRKHGGPKTWVTAFLDPWAVWWSNRLTTYRSVPNPEQQARHPWEQHPTAPWNITSGVSHRMPSLGQNSFTYSQTQELYSDWIKPENKPYHWTEICHFWQLRYSVIRLQCV